MSDFRRIVVQKILDDQNNLGVRADAKALTFLTALGAFTAFFLAFVKDIRPDFFSVSVLVIYFMAAILGIWNIIMVLNPQIRERRQAVEQDKRDPSRAAFFAEICKFNNLPDYKECLQDMLKDEETIVEVYSRQIYEVSIVIAAKYKHTRRAVYFIITALFAEFSLIAYLFVLNSILPGV
jgi:hypothetical protein